MWHFIIRKGILFFFTLLGASFLIHSIISLLPGDAALVMLGTQSHAEVLSTIRNTTNIQLPFWKEYSVWIIQILQGNLQYSFTYDLPISSLLLERLSVSLPLIIISILLALIVSVILGIALATSSQKVFHVTGTYFLYFCISTPSFWLALLLIIFFSVNLGLLPSGGFPGWEYWKQAILSLILPIISLTIPQIAVFTRIIRISIIQSLQEAFIITARAKGLPEYIVVWKHALYHALAPLLTIVGLQFSFLMVGAIIVENVFYLPGIGRFLLQAVYQRDIVVVKNIIVVLVFFSAIYYFLFRYYYLYNKTYL